MKLLKESAIFKRERCCQPEGGFLCAVEGAGFEHVWRSPGNQRGAAFEYKA